MAPGENEFDTPGLTFIFCPFYYIQLEMLSSPRSVVFFSPSNRFTKLN